MSFVVHAVALFSVAANPAVESIEVGPVWAGHPVGFCLYTHGDRQFVAYYDAERRMTVAVRKLDESAWHAAKLPEQLGWDSHNYVALVIDADGYIHLSGNMHVAPLVYYRTVRPLDVDSFERAAMVGERENQCTYPEFILGPKRELIFTYRDGRSGSGDQIFNVYDPAAKTWRRLLDTAFTSGQGKMNAYFEGPLQGPDGSFHLAWVWRDTPACETNHDICYARSSDLVHWETVSGRPLALPITIDNADIVDPVGPKGGVINGGVRLGFDSKGQVLISYHKFDEAGNTQIYVARFEDGVWKSRWLSDWDYRWEFSGGGAIPVEIALSPIAPCGKGKLKLAYRHVKCGASAFIIDETTLRVSDTFAESTKRQTPVTSDFPGMKIQRAQDSGDVPAAKVRYQLQWETLGANRDRPREGPIPPPSMLRVLRLERAEAAAVVD